MATEIQISAPQISVVNPATGKVLREFACASPADVSDVVSRARNAQPAWELTPLRKRLSLIKQFQRLLSERKQQIARVITSESGKPYAEALLTEILVALERPQLRRRQTGAVQGQLDGLPGLARGPDPERGGRAPDGAHRDRHPLSPPDLPAIHAHRNRSSGAGHRPDGVPEHGGAA